MKKLITTDLGGHPVYFKDFEFIQEQIRELALSTLGDLDDTIVTILNGGSYQVSTDGYTIDVLTEGWAYHAGEFFYIPVHSVTGSGTDVAKWVIVETNDPRGLKTFQDTTVGQKNVYLVRTLQVAFVPSPASGVDFSLTEERIKSTEWQSATAQSPFFGTFQYRLDTLGRLELIGYVDIYDTITNEATLYVLPIGYRPSYIIPFKQPIINDEGLKQSSISIKSSGEIQILISGTVALSRVYLQHTFYLQYPL
jgi:hypothetical protein